MSAPEFFNTESKFYATTSSSATEKAATSITIPAGARTAIVGIIIDEDEPDMAVSSFTFNDGSNNLTPLVTTKGLGQRSTQPVRFTNCNVYNLTGVATTSASASAVHTSFSGDGSDTGNAQFFVIFTDGHYKSHFGMGTYGDRYGFDMHSVSPSSTNETVLNIMTMDALQSTNLDSLSSGLEVVVEGGLLNSANISAVGAVGSKSQLNALQEHTATNNSGGNSYMSFQFFTFTSEPEGHLTGSIIR